MSTDGAAKTAPSFDQRGQLGSTHRLRLLRLHNCQQTEGSSSAGPQRSSLFRHRPSRGPNDPSSGAFSVTPEHERRTDRRTRPQRARKHETLNVDCSDSLGDPHGARVPGVRELAPRSRCRRRRPSPDPFPSARQDASADSSDEPRGPDALVGEAAQALILTPPHVRMRAPIPRTTPGVRPHRVTANPAALVPHSDAIPHCLRPTTLRFRATELASWSRMAPGVRPPRDRSRVPACLKISQRQSGCACTPRSAAAPDQRKKAKPWTPVSGDTGAAVDAAPTSKPAGA